LFTLILCADGTRYSTALCCGLSEVLNSGLLWHQEAIELTRRGHYITTWLAYNHVDAIFSTLFFRGASRAGGSCDEYVPDHHPSQLKLRRFVDWFVEKLLLHCSEFW